MWALVFHKKSLLLTWLQFCKKGIRNILYLKLADLVAVATKKLYIVETEVKEWIKTFSKAFPLPWMKMHGFWIKVIEIPPKDATDKTIFNSKMSTEKWWPFCIGRNELKQRDGKIIGIVHTV